MLLQIYGLSVDQDFSTGQLICLELGQAVQECGLARIL